MGKCRQCGKELTAYQQRDCQPKKGEVLSACQRKTRVAVQKAYNRNGRKKDDWVSKPLYEEPKHDVKCMKCGGTFEGNKYIRTCPDCHTHFSKTPTREPRHGIFHAGKERNYE